MGLIREPKNVDFTFESKPWTEVELRDFRKLMTELKSKKLNKKYVAWMQEKSDCLIKVQVINCLGAIHFY